MKTKKSKPEWTVGQNYFLRLATYHVTGQLVAVTPTELWLRDAAWIAETGRYSEALRTGVFSEVESYPAEMLVMVGRAAIIDGCTWPHPLPREVR